MDNGKVKICEIPKLKYRRTLVHTGDGSNFTATINYLAFAMSGEVLVTATKLGLIKLWDIPSGKELATLNLDQLARNQGQLHKVAVNPDGKYLLTGHNGVAVLWELPSGRQLAMFSHYASSGVNELAISPDDSFFLTTVYDLATQTKQVAAFELPSGNRMREFSGCPEMRWPVAWSTDGKLLATGYLSGDDSRPRVWQLPSCELLSLQVGHGDYQALEFSPDTKMLLSADKYFRTYLSYIGVDRYFSNMNPPQNYIGQYSAGIHRRTFAADGRCIVVPYRSSVAIVDVATRQPVSTISGLGRNVEFLSFLDGGRDLLAMTPFKISLYEPAP